MPSEEAIHNIGKVFTTSSPCIPGKQCITLVQCSVHPVHALARVNASHWKIVHHIQSMPPRKSMHHIGKVFTTPSPCLTGSQCITLVKCSAHPVHAFAGVNASHW